MVNTIQPDLDQVQSWCERNRLKLSITESKTLIIGSTNMLLLVEYTNRLHVLETNWHFVDKYKYLGIILDEYISEFG